MARLLGRVVGALVLVAAVRGALAPPPAPEPGEERVAAARSATLCTALGLLLYVTYLSCWPHFSADALSVEILAVSGLLAAPELLAGSLARLTPARARRVRSFYLWTIVVTAAVGSGMLGLAVLVVGSGGLAIWAVRILFWLLAAIVVVRITHRGWRSVHDDLLDRLAERFFSSGAVWLVAGPLFVGGTGIQFALAR